MSETAEIIRFQAGEEVPEWLLVQEPMDSESQRFGPLRFIADCIVLEQPTQYLICPSSMPMRVIEATALFGIIAISGYGMRLSAPAKDVTIPQAWCDVELDHPGAQTQTLDQVRAKGLTTKLTKPVAKPRLIDRIIAALTALFG